MFGTHPQKLVRTCRYLKLEMQVYPVHPDGEGGQITRAMLLASLPAHREPTDTQLGRMRNMFEKFRQVSGVYQWERQVLAQVCSVGGWVGGWVGACVSLLCCKKKFPLWSRRGSFCKTKSHGEKTNPMGEKNKSHGEQ